MTALNVMHVQLMVLGILTSIVQLTVSVMGGLRVVGLEGKNIPPKFCMSLVPLDLGGKILFK